MVRQNDSPTDRSDDDSQPGLGERPRRELDDRRLQPVLDQQRVDPLGRAGAFGSDHDSIAGVEHLLHLGHEARAVADHRIEAGRRHAAAVGTVGRVGHGERGRVAASQQAIEAHVQPGQALLAVADLDIPRTRQRRRQIGFFVDDVGRAVAQSLRFDEHDERVRGDAIEQHLFVVDQPRQPRFHAVELRAVGETLPLLAPPRLFGDQLFGSRSHFVVGQQLATREDEYFADRDGRALIVDGELAQPIDFVAPEIDANGGVGGRGEHIDDRTAHRELAAMLDLVLAAIADAGEPLDECRRIELVSGTDDDGIDVAGTGTETLHQRARGGDDEQLVRAFAALAQVPQRAQPAAHRLDAGAHSLEGQRLPRGEHIDPLLADEDGQVVRQPFGIGRSGHRDDDRAPIREIGQRRQRDGPPVRGWRRCRPAGPPPTPTRRRRR